MEELQDKITALVNGYLADFEDSFLVEVTVVERGKLRVLVIIDGDKGVSIDRCARISRKLGADIEAQNIIEDAYNLEVSSPGIDHPLKLRRQYVSNIGRSIKVTLKDGCSQEGKLQTVEDEHFTLLPQVTKVKNKIVQKQEALLPINIAFEDTEKVVVLISI